MCNLLESLLEILSTYVNRDFEHDVQGLACYCVVKYFNLVSKPIPSITGVYFLF